MISRGYGNTERWRISRTGDEAGVSLLRGNNPEAVAYVPCTWGIDWKGALVRFVWGVAEEARGAVPSRSPSSKRNRRAVLLVSEGR